MTECKNCGKIFSNRFKDENGKNHNCQRRKYCFDCSPYNTHNTSVIENTIRDDNGNRICKKCGKSFISKRRHICDSCNVNKQRQNKKDFLMSVVGNTCWHCGYGGEDKFIPLLEMHHVHPENKMFEMNVTELCKKSETDIISEAKKCVLLCNRCHREFHYTDIITEKDMIDLHEEKWKTIKSNIPG